MLFEVALNIGSEKNVCSNKEVTVECCNSHNLANECWVVTSVAVVLNAWDSFSLAAPIFYLV